MHIAPEIHRDEWLNLDLDDAVSLDWNRAVEIFAERIKYRYLEPADLLIKADENCPPIERKFGFSIMAIDCLLIEALQSFRDGLTNTKNKSLEMFKKYLTKRDGFRDYFDEAQAKNFFYDVRCGILHQAEIMGHTLLWSVGSLKGETADGTPYINRTKFHEILKEDFDQYCNELKNPANLKLRKNFRIKMDFIARKVSRTDKRSAAHPSTSNVINDGCAALIHPTIRLSHPKRSENGTQCVPYFFYIEYQVK